MENKNMKRIIQLVTKKLEAYDKDAGRTLQDDYDKLVVEWALSEGVKNINNIMNKIMGCIEGSWEEQDENELEQLLENI